MKIAEQLEINNIVLFKKATLRLNRCGVTTINGYNKDADRRNSEDNTNACGKSLLTSCIPQITVGTDAVTQDIKSRAKKDFFSNKNSSIKFKFKDHDNTRYSIEKCAKGKSFEYKIKKNGKPLKNKGIGYSEAKISRLLPYTEEEFFTLYYVDSRKPNILQFGSPTQRLQFFTNLFKQNSYDDLRKLFNGMLNELKKDKAVLEEVKSNVKELKHSVSEEDYDKLKSELDSNVSIQKSINNKVHDLYKVKQKLALVKTNEKLFNSFTELSIDLNLFGDSGDTPFESSKELNLKRKDIKFKLKELEEYLEQLNSYKEYKLKLKVFEEDHSKIVKTLEKIKDFLSKDEVKELKEYEDKLATLEKDYVKFKDIECSITEDDILYVKELLSSSDLSKEDISSYVEKLASKLSVLFEKSKDLKNSIKQLEELTDCTECPSCFQKIQKKQADRLIKRFNRELESCNKKVSKHSSNLAKLKRILNDYEDYEKLKNKPILKKRIRKLNKKIEILKPKYSNSVKREELNNRLALLKKPKKVDRPNISVDESLAERYRLWLDKAKIVLPIYDSIVNENFTSIDNRLQKIEGKLKKLNKKLEKVNTSIPLLSSKLEIYKDNKSRLIKLKERRNELKEKTDDIPAVELLIDAYSNKGLKLLIIKQIASIVEKNMNKFAPLLYKEKIKFIFDVSENKFDILMERTKGKKRISDVRRLSGAESRAFSFLLPLSILPLIPESRRMNFMVMDEPTVNLDKSTVSLFINSFIPKLNSVIPHIIIVSPLNESYHNQKRLTVVKENGYSSLVGD